MKNKEQARKRRKLAIRKKLNGTAEKPRVYLYKSNKYTYVGAADDDAGKVFVTKKVAKGVENAKKCGIDVGKALMKLKVETVVFDRSGYKYHGMTQAVAEGLREAGLKV